MTEIKELYNDKNVLNYDTFELQTGIASVNKKLVTDGAIELHMGYGDEYIRTEPVGIIGMQHFLCIGNAGQGKTNFKNFLLKQLDKKYDVDTLKVCDIRFLETDPTVESKIINHSQKIYNLNEIVKNISDIRKLCQSRHDFLLREGFKNTHDYNIKKRTNGKSEECIPRVLVLIDDCTVFNGLLPESKREILDDITYILKCGRVCGIHLGLFVSSNFDEFMPEDMLAQFVLRVILSHDFEVIKKWRKSNNEMKHTNKIGYAIIESREEFNIRAYTCKIPLV